ncbi:MAG: UTP--glucose-1-phosphate uridylyltransferase [Pseudomonadota bacterium]
MSKSPIKVAVIPVAGLGRRFLPATKVMPKEMLPIVDKPIVQYATEEAKAAGIEKLIFITAPGKTSIEDHLSPHPDSDRDRIGPSLIEPVFKSDRCAFVRQDKPRGLGHAVGRAQSWLPDEPFAVILPDELFSCSQDNPLQQMIKAHRKTGGSIIATQSVPRAQASNYGIIDGESVDQNLYQIHTIREKPHTDLKDDNLAVVGRYILTPDILSDIENIMTGEASEIQLTDAIARAIRRGSSFYGLSITGERFDCGQKAGFVAANLAFALKRKDISDDLKPYLQDLLGK